MNTIHAMLALKLVFGFCISLFTTLYFIPLLSSLAHRLGILDVPDAKLKNHKKPVAYLGGLAVYLGFIVSLALNFPFQNNLFLFLVGSTLLLFVGLIDDLIVMKPYQKIIGQMIATFCFLKGGYFLKETFLFSFDSPPTAFFWLFISFGWILTVINAFNLVDIMDGLSSTIALSSGTLFLIVALLFNVPTTALLLVAFLGAVLGFLWFNKPPASMYLGDAGSLFMGGILATVPFTIPWGTYVSYGYFTPLIILTVPLIEVAFLIVIRTWKRIPFYQGSPDHFSIYLQKKGWSKNRILFYMILVHVILGAFSISFAYGLISLPLALLFYTIFMVAWFLILRH